MSTRPSDLKACRVLGKLTLLLVSLAAAPGCNSSDRLDLTVEGHDFDHWAWADGKRVWVRPFASEAAAGPTQSALILGGVFRLAWPEALRAGVAHTLRYSVDTNGDGLCDAGDSGFTVEVIPAHANVKQAIAPQDPSTAADLCHFFD